MCFSRLDDEGREARNLQVIGESSALALNIICPCQPQMATPAGRACSVINASRPLHLVVQLLPRFTVKS